MKKRIIALVSIMALCLGMVAFTGCGSDEEAATVQDVSYVQDNGKLVVGITDFAPMDYKDKNGDWIGFDADLAKAFAESLGIEAEFIEIDWDNKQLELNNKDIDCIWNGMTLTPEIEQSMSPSIAYCGNSQIIVTKAEKAEGLKEAADAAELVFAVEKGSAGKKAAEENGYEFTEVNTQADAVMEVAAGTADACIIDSLMAGAMIGEGTSYEDLASSVALTSEEYVVGFRQGSDLTAAFNEWYKAAYEDGTVEKVAKKYGTQEALVQPE